MKLAWLLAVSALFLSAAEPADKAKQSSIQSRYSPEKLAKLRAQLAAQVAVFDSAEHSMRAPTPEESAALANQQPAAPQVRQLSNGGLAVSGAQSGINFLIVEQNPDRSVKIVHQSKPAVKPAAGGTNHVR